MTLNDNNLMVMSITISRFFIPEKTKLSNNVNRMETQKLHHQIYLPPQKKKSTSGALSNDLMMTF